MGNTGPYDDESILLNEPCSLIHANKLCFVEYDSVPERNFLSCSEDLNTCQLLHAQVKQRLEVDITCEDLDLTPSQNDKKCEQIYEKSFYKMGNRWYLHLPIKQEAENEALNNQKTD